MGWGDARVMVRVSAVVMVVVMVRAGIGVVG